MTFPRLRVFVSSKMQELAAERQAVKAALRDLEIEAWVFESDAGARSRTIQTTYLEEVKNADLYLGLFWRKYGESTVEEYTYAQSLGKDCLIYEKRSDIKGRRDSRLAAFLRSLGKIDSGLTIRWFQTLEELAEFVRQDVARWQAEIIRGNSKGLDKEGRPRSEQALITDYYFYLSSRVGTVRVFGANRTIQLEEAFVEPRLVNSTKYSYKASKWQGIVDRDLLRGRDIFAVDDQTDYSAPNVDNDTDYEEKQKAYFSQPLASLLRNRKGAVITGTPGSGKTTLLKYLVLKALNETNHLPVLLELKRIDDNQFNDSKGDVVELLFRKTFVEALGIVTTLEEQTLRGFFLQKLRAGQVDIYLDGLDEIRGARFFPALCRAINEFISSSLSRNLLIITTRPYALTISFEGLTELEIVPFDDNQIKSFLSHYCGNASLAKQVTLQIRGHRELNDLARVPFLLSIIAELLKDQNIQIVGGRSMLYRTVIDALVLRLDNEKFVDRFLVRDPNGLLKRTVLKSLAFDRLLMNPVNNGSHRLTFTDEEILEKAREFSPSQVSPFDLASDVIATPLIREIGRGTYAFAHLTIQEYLAAEVLTNRPDWETIFFRTAFDPVMVETELLPMTIGLLQSPGDLYKKLEKLPESITFANLRLRARGLGYSKSVPQPSVKKLADEFYNILARKDGEFAAYRGVVIRSFSSLDGDYIQTIVGRIITLLDHDSYLMKLYGAQALGAIGDPSAVPALLKTLGKRPNESFEDIRYSAVEALGNIGDLRAVMPIIKLLSDADENIRFASAEALGELRDLQAVQELLKTCEDNWTIVAWRAGKSLEEIGDAHTADEIIRFLVEKQKPIDTNTKPLGRETDDPRIVDWLLGLANEADEVIRWLVSAALMKLRDDLLLSALMKARTNRRNEMGAQTCAFFGKTASRDAVNDLVLALAHPDKLVRRESAEALGKIGDECALEALLTSLDAEYRDGIHDGGAYIIARAIARINNTRATDGLLAVLRDSQSFRVHQDVVEALGDIGDHRTVDELLQLLNDGHRESNWLAAEALGEIADPRAVDALLLAMQQGGTLVRVYAAKALGRIGDKRAVDGLLRVLRDGEIELVELSARVLAGIDQETIKGTTLYGRQFFVESIIEEAIDALGRIGDRRATGGLLTILKDGHFNVESISETTIRKITDYAELNTMFERLKDSHLHIRSKAAKALGLIGDERAIDGLLSNIQTEHSLPAGQGEAALALGKIGGDRALMALIEAMKSSDALHQSSIAQALGHIADARSVECLLLTLADVNSHARLNAVEALGFIGHSSSVVALLEAMTSKDVYGMLSEKAALALGKFESAELAKGLSAAVSQESGDVRIKAIKYLSYYANTHTELKLVSNIGKADPEKEVREAAHQATEQFRAKLGLFGITPRI